MIGLETRETTVAEVVALLERQRSMGNVDDRLVREAERPGTMFLGAIESPEQFLSLVWQSIPQARPLVPAGQPRTLKDCALRLAGFEWKFQTLVQQGYSWFQRCEDIDLHFDISRLGLIALTPLKQEEWQETPTGTFYIYDGVHRSVVVAKRLVRHEIEFLPQRFLLLTPRRS